MNARRRRFLWAALATVSVVALAVGTAGFDTASMARPVELEVAAHERAFVTLWDPGVGSQGRPPQPIAREGLAGEDPVTRSDQSVRIVAVVNRFAHRDITANATATSTPPGMHVGPFVPVTLGAGETTGLTAAVSCGSHRRPVTVALEVSVRADRLAATIPYTAVIDCASPPPTTTPAPRPTTEA
jgi:hypothetical protein